MSRHLLLLTVSGILFFCPPGRADFKYTQTAQITGGAMAGMMKGLGVISKSARQAMKPMETTTYVKGGSLRRDNADGTYQIIDLGGRRIIQVNPAARTYSVETFDEMRQAVEQMAQAMTTAIEQQQQQQNTGAPQNVTVTPKFVITPTGKTQTILGQDTQEVDVKMDLEVQATDPQHGTQSGTIENDVDSWVAPSVAGYNEVADFDKKMATEIGWTPNAAGMNPQMMRSMVELSKSGKIPRGLPMLVTFSMLSGAPPTSQNGAGQQAQGQQPEQQQPPSSPSVTDMSPRAAAAKTLGGMFGHRKKKQNADNQQNASAPQPAAPPNALMSLTTRVSSFSTASLDPQLFQVPAGYTEIQANVKAILGPAAR